jgi:DNA topoisomerase-6 subunit B
VERKPAVYQGGFAFQVEVGIGFGGNAGRNTGQKTEEGTQIRKMEAMRFANRVPLLFDAGGCALTKAVQSIEWKRYGIKDLENAPVTIFAHILSVHVPYTGAGKQAVTDEEEIMEELRLALMEAGRKIHRFIAGKKREQERIEKKRIFVKYATEIAIALSVLTNKKKEAIEKKLHHIVQKKLRLDELKAKREAFEEKQKAIEKIDLSGREEEGENE